MKTLLITQEFPERELRETLLQEGALHIYNEGKAPGFEAWLKKALEGIDYAFRYGRRGPDHEVTLFYIIRLRTRKLINSI